jgi:hypothetical protein
MQSCKMLMLASRMSSISAGRSLPPKNVKAHEMESGHWSVGST